MLAVALLFGVAWTLVTPPWQAPDENSHFGYVQHLVEARGIPGDPLRPMFSTEQSEAMLWSNADQAAAQPSNPVELRADVAQEFRDRRFSPEERADGGGPNPAAFNPPLYYLSVAPAYALTKNQSIFTRLWAVRLATLGWFMITVIGAWLVGRELFPTDDVAPVVTSGLAALTPMVQFISGSVNPDAALYAAWTITIWLVVRVIKRGLTWRRSALLGIALGIAILIKATSYALVPPVGIAMFVLAWRAGHMRRLLAGVITLAVIVVPWFVVASQFERPAAAQVGVVTQTGGPNVREFGSYVWQYYLPKLPFMTSFPTVAETLPAYDLMVKGSLGVFGWTEVQFGEAVYLAWACGIVAVLIGLIGRSLWRRELPDLASTALVAIVLTLVLGLHWAEFPQLKGGASNFIQGRYLLPLIAIAGVAFHQAGKLLPRNWQWKISGALIGTLLTLDIVGLFITLERFYA
jgi:4-amino-4-deoxy-L-arabinose transferase-like glycosyltransferase